MKTKYIAKTSCNKIIEKKDKHKKLIKKPETYFFIEY